MYTGRFVRLCLLTSMLASCGDQSPKREEEEIVIAAPERLASVTMETVEIPVGNGQYIILGPRDFPNGHYGNDIAAPSLPDGFSAASDERKAAENLIFLSAPGLVWKIDPPMRVTVTMRARGQSQSYKRDPAENGRLAVSFAAFDKLFPPGYREAYEISINSDPTVPRPFSHTYSFGASRVDAKAVYASLSPGDSVRGIRLGADTTRFITARLALSELCSGCVISVDKVDANLVVKFFSELPSILAPTRLRITFPTRFSGILTRSQTTSLRAYVLQNETAEPKIAVDIPGSLTTVSPWCLRKLASPCLVIRNGRTEATYFRFLNAVPSGSVLAPGGLGAIGGLAGTSQLGISGKIKLSVYRDSDVVESKDLNFSSGIYSVLDAPLPNWVLDDLRQAIGTGAPEFPMK